MYDCSTCPDNKFRKTKGCRLLDPMATRYEPIGEIRSSKDDSFFLDHCPGIYKTTPYLISLYELWNAKYIHFWDIGSYWDLPFPVIDSLDMLQSIKKFIEYEIIKEDQKQSSR